MSKRYDELIDRFEDGGADLRNAVRDVTREEACAHPGPGDWSIHELVVHLADTDTIAIDRMKRVLTEDNPPLLNADESAYIEKLHPHEQSFDEAVMLFDISRRQFARVLRCLADKEFKRSGRHDVAGQMTLEEILSRYNDHLAHHLKFLHSKLERLRDDA